MRIPSWGGSGRGAAGGGWRGSPRSAGRSSAVRRAAAVGGRHARRRGRPPGGKLRTQSAIDALFGKLDLNLWDCALLVRTGMLSDASGPSPRRGTSGSCSRGCKSGTPRPRTGPWMGSLRRSAATRRACSPCSAAPTSPPWCSCSRRRRPWPVVVESGTCNGLLMSEGVLPPLIRLAESGSLVGCEKAAITLQRLSAASPDAHAVVGHGGAGPLIALIFYA